VWKSWGRELMEEEIRHHRRRRRMKRILRFLEFSHPSNFLFSERFLPYIRTYVTQIV